jgi:hypothetical protein
MDHTINNGNQILFIFVTVFFLFLIFDTCTLKKITRPSEIYKDKEKKEIKIDDSKNK